MSLFGLLVFLLAAVAGLASALLLIVVLVFADAPMPRPSHLPRKGDES